jgi:hypothetical protein
VRDSTPGTRPGFNFCARAVPEEVRFDGSMVITMVRWFDGEEVRFDGSMVKRLGSMVRWFVNGQR